MFDFEVARAEALRDATIAFERVDIDGNGTIDYHEAEKLIKSNNSLNNFASNNENKIDAFFKSFDENGDKSISKKEWLNFYGQLFDNMIENSLGPKPTNKQ